MADQIPPREWSPRAVFLGTLVVCGVTALFALLIFLHMTVFLLFVAIVFATALAPLIAWVERRGLSHPMAVVLVYAVLVTVSIGLVAGGAPLLLDQAVALVDDFPKLYHKAHERLLTAGHGRLAPWVTRLPDDLPTFTADGSRDTASAAVVDQTLTTVGRTLDFIRFELQLSLIAMAVILVAFYWSLQEERTVRSLLLWLPSSKRDAVRDLIAAIKEKVGAYARGQGIVCLAMAVMSLVTYGLLGLPYFIVLALIAGILEAIPYFGPLLGAIAPIAIALSIDPGKAIWVAVAAFVLQQVESYLLVPRIMDRSVGVHPMVTLLAIAGFGSLLGLPGAVMAIPMAAILQLLLDRFVLSRPAIDPPKSESRDAVGVLRYQARELIQDIRNQVREKPEVAERWTDGLEEEIEAIACDLNRELETTAAATSEAPSEGEAR